MVGGERMLLLQTLRLSSLMEIQRGPNNLLQIEIEGYTNCALFCLPTRSEISFFPMVFTFLPLCKVNDEAVIGKDRLLMQQHTSVMGIKHVSH